MINSKLRYSNFCKFEACNGFGVGCTLFFKQNGKLLTEKEIKVTMETLQNKNITRLTLSGESLDQPIDELIALLNRVKTEVGKPIWLWTGYTFTYIENSPSHPRFSDVLDYVDYVIDGEFVEELKDLNLPYRGSSNQNIWKKDDNGIWNNITKDLDKR